MKKLFLFLLITFSFLSNAQINPVTYYDFQKQNTTQVTYYVRPSGGSYGTEDGLSYTNAWDGFSNVNWSLVENNILAICGTHTEVLGVGGNYATIIGNDVNEAGTLDFGGIDSTGIDIDSKQGIIINNLTFNNATVQNLFIRGNSTVTTNNCISNGSGNQAIQHFDTCVAIHNNLSSDNNVDDCISQHNTSSVTVNGGSFSNSEAGINTIEGCTTIINNATFFGNIYDIWAANATTAESCVITANDCTFTDQVLASNLGKVILNNCNAPNVVLSASGSNKGYLVAVNSVIGNFTPANNIATLTGCRVNDITTQVAGGLINLINSYVKPVGVFDVNGTLRAIRTFFDGTDCTDHTIDVNSGSTFKLEYCVFKNPTANKYALSLRTGSTIEALEGLTISGTNNVGRGVFSQRAITLKNTIITDLDVGVTASVSGQNVTMQNGCLFDNNTTANGSGSLIQNDMQNTDPLFVDEVNNNYSLGVGSALINTGTTLINTLGFLTANWGNSTTVPVITTQTLSTFNIGAF